MLLFSIYVVNYLFGCSKKSLKKWSKVPAKFLLQFLIEINIMFVNDESNVLLIPKKAIEVKSEKILHLPTQDKNVIRLKSRFLYRQNNSEFSDALSYLFIHNNWYKNRLNSKCIFVDESTGEVCFLAVNVPKYFSYIQCKRELNLDTGEFFEGEIIEVNNLSTQRGKLKNKLKEFDAYFSPLYKEKRVSVCMLTLTRANYAKHCISSFLKAYKRVLKASGQILHGLIWCSEVSYETGKPHWHYHIMFALERIECKGAKKPLYMQQSYLTQTWGQRATCTFWQKRYGCESTYVWYMAKVKKYTPVSSALASIGYLSKHSGGVILGLRRYSSSRKYTTPILGAKYHTPEG